jgi:glyoxylase-like metal-dependent hydrolase (beta-lactamase superfamily II)
MILEIKPIALKNYLGSVNSYLIKTNTGFILIDTGWINKREILEKALESAGCKPGNLKLIIQTHGDFDHTGSAAYIREKYSSKIAMHGGDSGMVEQWNMFWNRKKGNIFFRMIVNTFLGIGGFKPEKFEPDLRLEDGDDFSEYGFDAKVLHLSGHSKGSIGILTAEGDLFCGDLLENTDKPTTGSIIDDSKEFDASIEKLKSLEINTVYPGHGEPFPMEVFLKSYRK